VANRRIVVVSVLLAVLLAVVLVLAGCGGRDSAKGESDAAGSESKSSSATGGEQKTFKIGYSVIVEHPALQTGLKGILEGLEKEGFVVGKNLEFDNQNAQGDMANAHNIAEKFVADQVDLIIGHTTPTAQAAVEVAKGTGIPVVFFAVTDPVSAGLVESVDGPSGTSVTGYYVPGPIGELFDFYAEIVPDMQKIGTIYNPSEDNSVAMIAESKAVAERHGYEWIEATVTSSADVKTAAESLVGKVDTIIIVQDNTVISALEAVIMVGEDNRLPVFTMDIDSVGRGAIASLASDPYREGMETSGMIARILRGEDCGKIAPMRPTKYDIHVNLEAAKRMGVTIPKSILDKAVKVYGQ
jgi:putative ABC transport system substrate-binding protein